METESFVDKQVVVDTSTSWLYLGRLVEDDGTFLVLAEADAFDLSETSLSKHEYLMRVKQDGIAPNRKRVSVVKSKIVALTLVEDILDE